MQTTLERLVQIYDATIDHLEKRVKDGTITSTELSELRKILDSASVRQLVRAGEDGKAPGAVPLTDLPFTPEDSPEVARQTAVYR